MWIMDIWVTETPDRRIVYGFPEMSSFLQFYNSWVAPNVIIF